MHNFVYDPEGPSMPSLTPGSRYQGTPVPDSADVDINVPKARVPKRDLIVPRSLPADKLRRALPHVAHEARMLLVCYLQRSFAPAYTSWFVHARNLMDFLEGKGHEKDEICAQLYLAGHEHAWHEARRRIRPPGRYTKYRRAANKLAAHLTFDRIKYERRRFPPDRLLTEYLLGNIVLFAARLDPRTRRRFVSQLLPPQP
jgi:hypothetical protein